MHAVKLHEYCCPQCGQVNHIRHDAIQDLYKEQFANCSHCRQRLEIVPANGLEDSINLIISIAPIDEQSR